MKMLRHKLILLILILCCTLSSLRGQDASHLVFVGLLTDMEGSRITNEQFDLRVELKQKRDQSLLFKSTGSVFSDQEGWFESTIENFSGDLPGDGSAGSPLVLVLEFLPNEHTEWIDKDEDFRVSYTLSPFQGENRVKMEIKRQEGSELMEHLEEHFSVFKDQFPFAYLTGGILLSDHYPADKQLLEDLKIWISPSEEEESEAKTRGVKGGFPTGGYHRKKK